MHPQPRSLQRHVLDGEIIPPAETVRVIGRTHPLAGRRVVCEVPAGLSIAEILQRCAGTSYAGGFAVYLGEHPIPARHYARIRVKPGATIVFVPRLQDNTWRLVASAVIVIAALVIAPYLAPGIIAAGAAIGVSIATTTAVAIASASIMLAGTLALNALFPVRPPELSAKGAGAPFNSIQGANNQSNPYGAVPVVLGLHRQSPFYGAKAYTELVGNDQYLRLLFVCGYGPLQIGSLQIGETAIGSYSDVQIESRQGFPGDAPITLYPARVDEQALSIVLQNRSDPPRATGHAPWTDSVVSAVDADEISIDFIAPSGINMTDSKGNDITWVIPINVRYRLVGASTWISATQIVFTRSFEPARKGLRIAVARGQYEVQAQKPLGDGDPQYTRDQVTWTALRSMKTGSPITFDKPLALIALRIKATNQLSGVIATLNCITVSLVKAWNGAAWVANQPSTWPSDLFRHVLQGPANARPVADSQIDLVNLQDWWTYCVANGFQYNKVLTDSASVYDRLQDVAAAGRAVTTFIDGKWGVVWDRPTDPIVQHFTPRNSWGFKGQRIYAQQPHAWRVPFINATNGWTQDERTVYDDGYDVSNATLFERVEFPGVTDPDLIWRHGRFHIAQSRLRPENLSLSVGWEHLVCTRGDRVVVTHDAMLVGLASGRLKSIAGQVVTFDEEVTIEVGKTYGITVRVAADVRSITRAVDDATAPGETNSLTLVGDLSALTAGDLFSFGETGRETATYRVRSISHQRDLIALLGLVDDAPDIALADHGEIPAYDPHVTIPADPLTLPPRSLKYLEVIDGRGATARALVRLVWQLPRLGSVVSFDVQARDDDAGGDWVSAGHVLAPTMSADVPLTSAGIWSFRVRCVFDDGTVSDWATLASLNLAGLSTAPGDITNLHIRAIDGQTVLDWTVVEDPRILFYEIRKGTSWDTGLVVGDAVAQPPWGTTGDGTYHLRAYVLSPFDARIYSAGTASITVVGAIIARNIIVSHDEQVEGWAGRLQGGVIDGSFIRTDIASTLTESWATDIVSQLVLEGLHIAIYVSPVIVNIGQAAECRFWTEFEASGILQGDDFLAQPDVLGSGDILGVAPTRYIEAFPIWRFADGAANDVFAPTDIFAPSDVFSADIAWGDWVAIASGTRVSRYFQAGMVLITNREDTNAVGTKFSWFVDVPDRTDDYTALSVPNTGLDVTFYAGGYNAAPAPGAPATPFNGGPNGSTVPHVQRAIVNGTNGDEVKITNLTLSGCKVFVVNAGSNVTRAGVNLLVRGF